MPQSWKKTGDFSESLDRPHSLVIRQVQYKSTQQNSKLHRITVLDHNQDEIIFSLKIKPEDYDALVNSFVAKGHLKPNGLDKIYHLYTFRVGNFKSLEECLNILIEHEPSIKSISNEILSSVKPYLKNIPAIEGWKKIGSFSTGLPMESSNLLMDGYSGLTNSETYISTSPLSKLVEINLLGYMMGTRLLTINVKDGGKEEIIALFLRNSITISSLGNVQRIKLLNLDHLTNVLNKLTEFEESVGAITNLIQRSYSLNMPSETLQFIANITGIKDESEPDPSVKKFSFLHL